MTRRVNRTLRAWAAELSLWSLAFWSLAAYAAAEPSADELARVQRLEAVIARLSAADAASNRATAQGLQAQGQPECHTLYAGLDDDLNRSWSRLSAQIWVLRAHCADVQSGVWNRRQMSLQELQQSWQPVLAHFAAMPAAARLAEDMEVWQHFNYWQAMRHHGHTAEADTLELQAVQRWVSNLAARPDDAFAQQAVLQITRYLYGQRSRGAFLQQLHQLFVQHLGPGHLHTLAMLRVQVYHQRLLGRPAQALALSDELVALLARHHAPQAAGVERMAMMNRSERVDALAGVGRYADALDEGRLLLAWLQQQGPSAHANVMRSAYNLAGVCTAMADYDEAVRYAQIAIDAGHQAASFGDRHETWLPTVQRAHARLLRGDADAAAALEEAVNAMPPGELNMAQVLFDLVQRAGRDALRSDQAQAQTQAQATAHALLRHLVEHSTSLLQSQRALPLLLAAEAAPQGSPGALASSTQALAYGLLGRDLPLDVQAHFALARQVAAHGAPGLDGALWLYKRGAQTLRSLRLGLPEAAAGGRSAFTQAFESDLRAFVGLLIDSGRLAEAEQALNVLRDEELHEFRRRSRGAAPQRNAGAAGLSYTPDEQRRNAVLQPSIAALQAQARAAEQRSDQMPTYEARVGHRDPAAQAALAHTAQVVGQLALEPVRAQAMPQVPAQTIAALAPHENGAAQRLAAPPPPGPTLAPGIARISYFLRPAHLDVVLQTKAGYQRISVPYTQAFAAGTAGSTGTNRAVQALRADLQRPGPGVPASAQALHRLLIAPLGSRLAGVRHLHIVPDGALRYVPFAVLHDGRQYLAQRFSISTELGRQLVPPTAATGTATGTTTGTTTSAANTPTMPKARPTTRLVAFGRTLGDARHSALPGVQHELAVLAALRGARVVPALDAQFTAASLGASLLTNPQVVHLASHFVLDPAGEEASYLLLGDGARLPLRALRDLPWAGVQLALLSACDSGLALDGGDAGTASQGRELAGFAATLHAAGVKNVMATLWRIDDAATAQWMQAFYAPWRSTAGHPAFTAQHLAQTQRNWLRQHAGTAQAHPYYWAAFSWMGQAL